MDGIDKMVSLIVYQMLLKSQEENAAKLQNKEWMIIQKNIFIWRCATNHQIIIAFLLFGNQIINV